MTRETAGSRPAARYLDGPVAIIGAGIGGLTAALSLQHFGVPVRVFEQARALREIGAGVTITPNAMNVLDFLGIGSALAEQAGETLRYFVRSAADGRVLERGPDPDSFVPEFGAPYCNLHRADLHSALTDAVTNNDPDAILLNHRFDHLEQDGDKVIAHFSNRTTYEAPALIGADGGSIGGPQRRLRRAERVIYRARGAAGTRPLHASAPGHHRGSVRPLRRGRRIIDPLSAEASDHDELAG